jgi:hypothetical protein
LKADLVDGTKDGTDHAGTLYLSREVSRLHHLEDRIKVCRRNISRSGGPAVTGGLNIA